jgi:hypothetical protein
MIEDADHNTKIQVEESADENKIRFDTAGAERMIIDNLGNVGIGIASPTQKLDVVGNIKASGDLYADKIRRSTDSGTTTKINLNDEVIKIYAGHGSNQICTVNSAGLKVDAGLEVDGAAIFNETGADKDFRVESSGKNHMLLVDGGSNTVVMGANSVPSSWAAPPVASDVCHFQGAKVIFGTNSPDANGGVFAFNKSRNATEGAHTIVQNNDKVGKIDWMASDGSNFDQVAEIAAHIDGVPGGGTDMPGRLVFSTTPDGEGVAIERMRIDSGGHVGIHCEDPGSGVQIDSSLSLNIMGGSNSYAAKTSNYALTDLDFTVVANCGNGDVTLQLPNATTAAEGRIYVIKRLDSGAGTPGDCDLDPNGNLDGATDSKPLHNQESITVQCITGGWIIIGAYMPPPPPGP